MAKRNKQEKDTLDNIIDQLDLNGVTQEELFGEDGLVKALTSRILNKALQAEMDNHLGYQKNDCAGNNSGNNRNGYSTKKVMTQDQEVELSIPRDRNGEFSPVLVPKYEKRLPIFNEQI
ncbi:MAG: transposase, partial [Sphaerochaetaceae bacterium]